MNALAVRPYASAIARFHDVDMQIHDVNGEKWVTASQLARALGYGQPDALRRLINRNILEFRGKIKDVKLTSLPGSPSMIINYHGVIREVFLQNFDDPDAAIKRLAQGPVTTAFAIYRKRSAIN